MPQVGPAEIIVVLVVALLVFGPKRLPEVGRQVGRGLRELRKLQDTVRTELHDVMDAAERAGAEPSEPASRAVGPHRRAAHEGPVRTLALPRARHLSPPMAPRLRLRRRSGRPRTPDASMSMLDHLAELRTRILISVFAVIGGAIVAFVFSNRILVFLQDYYRDAINSPDITFIFLAPADAFITRLKIATYGGIVLALPVWLYQLWRFITPGLNPKERRYAVPFVASAILLFAAGAFVAFLTLEPALHFLLTVGGDAQQPMLTADHYVTLVSLMVVAFGISFEFPVVLVFLLIARVLRTEQLARARRWAAVGIITFAAIITPSQDPYSLLFMAVPMYLFYEGAIIIGRILRR